MRRLICQLTTKNYNHIFLEALKQLRQTGDPPRTVLRKYLLGLDGEASRWPDDSAFREATVNTAAYTAMGPSKTQMLLQALERASYSGLEEGVRVPWMTIEHVLPQHPSSLADWPYQDGAKEPTLEQMILRAQVRETLGNLTLVTQPLNSSLSNGPFRDKRPALALQSQLRLNTFFQTYDRESWFESDIIARGQQLAALAGRVWPRE